MFQLRKLTRAINEFRALGGLDKAAARAGAGAAIGIVAGSGSAMVEGYGARGAMDRGLDWGLKGAVGGFAYNLFRRRGAASLALKSSGLVPDIAKAAEWVNPYRGLAGSRAQVLAQARRMAPAARRVLRDEASAVRRAYGRGAAGRVSSGFSFIPV